MWRSQQAPSAPPLLLWLALGVVVVAGSLLDVMEVDAAQYATMARDMLHQPDKLKLYFRGQDYLDKPPLLFWLSALSFHIFGIHNWSYKLPSILAAVWAVYATFRYARLFNSLHVAHWAAFVLASSVAFLLMTNDVRTDTLLTAAVITAMWTGGEFLVTGRTAWLVWASVAVAMGMLAKGPMGFVAPAVVLGLQLLGDRRWKQLLDVRLLLIPVIVLLLLLPMLKGLYDQHGAHGIRFFFWEQSFGRITGENRWKDDSTVLYFTHELPWLLLPWTVFVLMGWWRALKGSITGTERDHGGPWGALLLFVALSLSQFKLPHYIYPVLPLLAVYGARSLVEGLPVALAAVQRVLWLLLILLAMVLLGWCFPQGWPLTALLAILLVVVIWFRHRHELLLFVALWSAVAWGINTQFYPALLRYQSNAQVGRWLHEQEIAPDRLLSVGVGGTALEFYGAGKGPYVARVEELDRPPSQGAFVLIGSGQLPDLVARFPPRDTVLVLEHLPVQMLSLEMILPSTRPQVVDQHVVLAY
jgi:hypothetical protein